MQSSAAAFPDSPFSRVVDTPQMVYARKGALNLPANLSPEDKLAWAKNIANNLIGGLLADKSSTIYLPSKVPRGDRIKLLWLDPASSTLKEKVVQVDQLEKSYVIAVRGQPSLASNTCLFAHCSPRGCNRGDKCPHAASHNASLDLEKVKSFKEKHGL